jgi:hypothetical protein
MLVIKKGEASGRPTAVIWDYKTRGLALEHRIRGDTTEEALQGVMLQKFSDVSEVYTLWTLFPVCCLLVA